MSEKVLPSTNDSDAGQETIFSDVYDLEPYEKTLKNARIWLYVISGIQFLMGIFEYANETDRTIGIIAFVIDAFIALLFLILALWSRKKPVASFTIALVIYLLLQIVFMLTDPTHIFRGIIIKIFVIIALVKANRDARKYEEIKSLTTGNI